METIPTADFLRRPVNPRLSLAMVPTALVMILLLCAGISKFAALGEFNQEVASWTAYPIIIRKAAVFLVPLAELGLSSAWLLGFRRALIAMYALMFLLAITAAYVIQVWAGAPPKCNCLGVLSAYITHMQSVRWHVGINLSLVLLLGYGGACHRLGSRVDVTARQRTKHSGFTLVEILVVIVTVAVLLAIAIPGLSGVRRNARTAALVSSIRQHVAVFTQYAVDYKDTWPCAVGDGQLAASGIETIEFGPYGMYPLKYFEFSAVWPILLAPGYYDNNYVHASFGVPGWSPGPVTPFHYSATFLADPGFWEYDQRVGPAQWRSTHCHEVVFPSSKSLLVNWVYLANDENAIQWASRA